jgi:PKD repeat protein
VLAAAFIAAIFFLSLISVEISRLQQAGETTQAMQTFAEERRLEESLDSLLKMTEPRTKETVAELIANCSYYGADQQVYGGIALNCRDVLQELFDGFYGRENYYVKIPRLKFESSISVQLFFIVDTSKSMEDDLEKIGTSIEYLTNNFSGDINFFIYTLALYTPVHQCSYPNVTCAQIPKNELKELCKQAGIPDGKCVYQEAYGLGIAWWASKYPEQAPNTIRIIVPASDELSCSDKYVWRNMSVGGPDIADKSIDFAIESIKNHENVRIYPMWCDPKGVNPPGGLPQEHMPEEIREDMERLASSSSGMLLDFSEGYSQIELNKILERIVAESTVSETGVIEFGTKKENAEHYSFERAVLMPNKNLVHFTVWMYKERVPHEIEIVRVKMPPIAIINANPTELTEEPFTAHFNGRASYDPDGGSIVSYKWDIDGTQVSTQPEFSYTFTSEGSHTIRLTVVDDDNQEGSATITIWVGSKPRFDFIFVPINWQGSNEEFERIAKKHFQMFAEGANLQSCPENYVLHIVQPNPYNCSISLLNSCFPSARRFEIFKQLQSCAEKAGYSINWATTRISGITKSDICVDNMRAVVGFTELGSYPTVVEHGYADSTAHELGHTFYFCEQYNQRAWQGQNKRLAAIGGCKNYYPDGSTHCPEYGSLTTNCPEYPGKIVDCKGRKIPLFGKVGRSIMGPALPASIPRAFDCFETKVIRGALKCS